MGLFKKRHDLYLSSLFLIIGALCVFEPAMAEDAGRHRTDRYGLAATMGKAYDFNGDMRFYLLSGVGQFDYEKIWHDLAPESLRFKVEFSIGEASWEKKYIMSSANIFVLNYIDYLANDSFKPYFEGGIGVTYTGFKVNNQGLKINFNPQMGVGAEFKIRSGDIYFTSLRLHHLSNGRIYHPRRGVNSILFIVGRFF